MLCRRSQPQPAAAPLPLANDAPEPAGLIGPVVAGALILALIAAIGFALHALAPDVRAVASAERAPRPSAPGASTSAAVPRATTPAAAPAAAAPTAAVDPTAVPADPNAPGAQPAALAAGPALEPQAVPSEPPPSEAAARAAEDERLHAEVMAAIEARERARARAAEPAGITLYGTSWCGACKAARAHMQSHGIAFTERDVEHDREAKAQQLVLNPRGSVPTIDVDGQEVLVGFNPDALDAAVARSLERRGGS